MARSPSFIRLENQISEATRLDAPMQKGPLMRWQKKALEKGVRSLSVSSDGKTSCNSPARGPSSASPLRYRGTPTGTSKCVPKSPTCKGRTPVKASPLKKPNDRFIPNRATTDMENGHFKIMCSENDENMQFSPTKQDFQKKMSDALNNGQPQESKILSFKQKAPTAREGYANSNKVLYSCPRSTGPKASVSRVIPQQPERILDAPELLDDYYLNLLSWSSGNQLAVALGGGVYIWNAATGSIIQLCEMEQAEDYVSSLSWIQEGNILAAGNSLGAVQVWDVGAQKLIRTMGGHASRVSCLSWNSHIVSSGSRTGSIHHHDVRVGEHHVGTLARHTQEVCGLAWAPDGRMLASGANDNMLYIWDAGLGHDVRPVHVFTEHLAAVKALAWCPWQDNLLASGGGTADRHIRLWNTHTGTLVKSVDTNSQVCGLLWSAPHRELISGHGFSHNQLTLWKYPSMDRIADLKGHSARILCMCLSPDGTTVASAAADETLRLWKCFTVDKEKKVKGKSTSESVAKSSRLASTIR